MLDCCQPAAAIKVSYEPSIQNVQTPEHCDIFHSTLID